MDQHGLLRAAQMLRLCPMKYWFVKSAGRTTVSIRRDDLATASIDTSTIIPGSNVLKIKRLLLGTINLASGENQDYLEGKFALQARIETRQFRNRIIQKSL